MGGPAIINGKTYYELDNFYRCKIEYMDMIWCSSEHLFQALKFKDVDYIREINVEGINAQTAWAMGQSRCHPLIDNYEERKSDLMHMANKLKFTQNPHLKSILLSTGNDDITFRKSTPYWNSQNSLILERIRNELKN